jgi:hypothetical protein
MNTEFYDIAIVRLRYFVDLIFSDTEIHNVLKMDRKS